MRRVLQNLVLCLVAIMVAAGLGELVVRLLAPQQLIQLRPDLFRPVDTLGWAHRPNVHTQVNTGDRTVNMFTDSGGFRVAATGRPPGQIRVLLLGDSFAAAMQVEYEQSFAGLIEQCFPLRTGRSAAVWNAGVDGWDPPQYSLQARRLLGSQPFDLVLVSVYLGNDIVDRGPIPLTPRLPDPRYAFRVPRRFESREWVDAILAPINDGLETRSHLFVLFKNRFQRLLMGLGLTGVQVPTELRRDQAGSTRWSVTGGILAGIDSMAKARGIPAVFATIPSVEQVDLRVFKARVSAFRISPDSLDLDQPDRLLNEQLERNGLSVVSLLEPFREAQQRRIPLYGKVDAHLSPEGHRVVWNHLASLLATRLGISELPGAFGNSACSAP